MPSCLILEHKYVSSFFLFGVLLVKGKRMFLLLLIRDTAQITAHFCIFVTVKKDKLNCYILYLQQI
jgi:hypothetical protein